MKIHAPTHVHIFLSKESRFAGFVCTLFAAITRFEYLKHFYEFRQKLNLNVYIRNSDQPTILTFDEAVYVLNYLKKKTTFRCSKRIILFISFWAT